MRPSRRQFLSLAVTSASAFALAAGIAPRRAGARPLDDVTASGFLRVAVYRDNPPFSFRKGGRLTGIDVDLAEKIAEKLGVRVDHMEQTAGETVSDDLRNAVWKGHYLGGGVADVMMHVPYSKDFALRNTEAVLFCPYQRENFAMARSPLRVPHPMLAALPDEPVGVELDSLPDFYLLRYLGGRLRERVVHYRTIPEAVDGLEKGEVSAVVATQSQIEAALGERAKDFPVTPVAFSGSMMAASWDIGMAVKENAHDLAYAVEDAVAALRQDGTLDAIFHGYGVTHNTVPIE